MKKAEDYKQKIKEYIDKQKKKYEGLLFSKKTIKEAFDHFKQLNSDKNKKTING